MLINTPADSSAVLTPKLQRFNVLVDVFVPKALNRLPGVPKAMMLVSEWMHVVCGMA